MLFVTGLATFRRRTPAGQDARPTPTPAPLRLLNDARWRYPVVKIVDISGGYVAVELDPGQCLAIAEAAKTQGNDESENDAPERAAYFDLLGATFNALALVAMAKCAMGGDVIDTFSLDFARANYPVVPAPKKGARG